MCITSCCPEWQLFSLYIKPYLPISFLSDSSNIQWPQEEQAAEAHCALLAKLLLSRAVGKLLIDPGIVFPNTDLQQKHVFHSSYDLGKFINTFF